MMPFDNPKMREVFIELHGWNKSGAKYKIGDNVVFTTTLGDRRATWTGKVQTVNHVEGDQYEYLIEGAPVLAWEEELKTAD